MKKMICMLTTAAMLLSLAPTMVWAETVEDNLRGNTIDEVPAGAEMERNEGIITANIGKIKTNYGNVTTNTSAAEIEFNVGIVHTNDGTVRTNNDTVNANTSNGIVIKNSEDAWVGMNEGMVHTNDGTVSGNSGVVETNNGIVTINAGMGNESGTIEINNGTVECNNGTVVYNYGTIEENHGGTVKYNLGGTVTGGTSADYFKLEGFSGKDLQLIGNFVKHDGVYWLKKDGTAAIKPGASGYFLTELTVAGGNVSQNSDGSFAVTSDGDAVTIGDMEMLAVSGGEAGTDFYFGDGVLHINKSGNYTLSGKARGIKVFTDGQVILTFDGVEVTASEGNYAMEVDSGTVMIQLKAGTENKLNGGITIDEIIRNQRGVNISVDGSMAISGKVDDMVPIIPREGMRMEVKVGANADTAKAVAGSPFTDGRLLRTEKEWDLSNATNAVDLEGYDYVYFGEAPDEPAPKKKTKKYDVIIEQVKNGKVKVDDDYAKRGQEITITVTPDKGYELDELTIIDQFDEEVDYEKGKKENTFVFDMPKSDVKIESAFQKVKEETEKPTEIEETKVPAKVQKEVLLTIDSRIVMVDGKPVVNDVAPILKGERTYLPIRLIAEEAGADVAWDQDTQSVTITKDGLEIVIVIGQTYALVNGERVALYVPAFIENGRTYLPLRFVAENLGAEVIWNGADSTVTVRFEE